MGLDVPPDLVTEITGACAWPARRQCLIQRQQGPLLPVIRSGHRICLSFPAGPHEDTMGLMCTVGTPQDNTGWGGRCSFLLFPTSGAHGRLSPRELCPGSTADGDWGLPPAGEGEQGKTKFTVTENLAGVLVSLGCCQLM